MYATFITTGMCNALLTQCEVKIGQVLFCVFIIIWEKRELFLAGSIWEISGGQDG